MNRDIIQGVEGDEHGIFQIPSKLVYSSSGLELIEKVLNKMNEEELLDWMS